MGFDWNGAAEGGIAERVPDGIHKLKVLKVLTSGKGGVFRSKKGDPQILVVLGDRHGREAGMMHTLSDKAGWTLAKLMSRCGVDLDALKAGGIEPKHFANPGISESWLVGKYTWARVETEPGEDGKSYVRVHPLTALEAGKGDTELDAPLAPAPTPKPPAADPFRDADEDAVPF